MVGTIGVIPSLGGTPIVGVDVAWMETSGVDVEVGGTLVAEAGTEVDVACSGTDVGVSPDGNVVGVVLGGTAVGVAAAGVFVAMSSAAAVAVVVDAIGVPIAVTVEATAAAPAVGVTDGSCVASPRLGDAATSSDPPPPPDDVRLRGRLVRRRTTDDALSVSSSVAQLDGAISMNISHLRRHNRLRPSDDEAVIAWGHDW